MATVADAITYARQKAQTDSNGISDTNGLAWANTGKVDITRELIKRNIDASKVIESSATISPTDNPPGRFAWPPDMFMLKTISVNFTDSSQANFIQCSKMDVANIQGTDSVDDLRLNQSTTRPIFTNHGATGEIFPTVIRSAIIKIFYYLAPEEYISTASTVVYPQSLDYRCLGDKILEAYYQSQENFDAAKEWSAIALGKINDSIVILGPQSQQPTQPQSLQITGWQF